MRESEEDRHERATISGALTNFDERSFPIDRFEPIAHIGSGTVSTVYLCRDRALDKQVAVKILRSLTLDQLVTFQNEAKTTARLNHPNIVRILDFGTVASSYPYMVMEYVAGKTLKQSIEENGPFDPVTATAIVLKVADALAYAHEQGVFHRDLQSGNIILDERGSTFTVSVFDFGLARTKEDTLEPTLINGKTIVGTPFYMSPDQVNGLAYDARSEIYSLGCVLFEILTGSPPFVGTTALETITMHAQNAPPHLLDFVNDAPITSKLDQVITNCLAKDPSARYQSMNELKVSLEEALLARPVTTGITKTMPPHLVKSLSKMEAFSEKPVRHRPRIKRKLLILVAVSILVAIPIWFFKAQESLIPQLPSITCIKFKGDWVDDRTIASLNSERLVAVSLNDCLVSGKAIEHLARLKNLDTLELYDSKLADSANVGSVCMKRLKLDDSTLTESVLVQLRSCPSLKALTIRRRMHRSQDAALIRKVLDGLPKLKNIEWSN